MGTSAWIITEAGRSPKAFVGAIAASEARKEEGVGGGGAGAPLDLQLFGTKKLERMMSENHTNFDVAKIVRGGSNLAAFSDHIGTNLTKKSYPKRHLN